jgi:hypothetical protein
MVNLKARIKRLEQSAGLSAIMPPIEFFDHIGSNSVSPEEWERWEPWLMKNLGTLPDEQLVSFGESTSHCFVPGDAKL